MDVTDKEWRNSYRLNFTTKWAELEKLKREMRQMKSKNDLYDEFWERKTLGV